MKSTSFTLTVSIPAESGELHGWRIRGLLIPGRYVIIPFFRHPSADIPFRLARLNVQDRADAVHVHTSNVRTFSVRVNSAGLQTPAFVVDGQTLQPKNDISPGDVMHFSYEYSAWKVSDFRSSCISQCLHERMKLSDATPAVQHSGRIQAILNSPAPLTIVIPSKASNHFLSAALRIAHDLDLYLRLDSEIVDDEEAMHRLQNDNLGGGNIVVLGGLQSQFFEWTVKQKKTSFTVSNGELNLRGRSIDGLRTASLFLHPHPSEEESLMLMIHASDLNALEKAVRLFPIRTGINLPDWIVIGDNSDDIGAGDVRGAG